MLAEATRPKEFKIAVNIKKDTLVKKSIEDSNKSLKDDYIELFKNIF